MLNTKKTITVKHILKKWVPKVVYQKLHMEERKHPFQFKVLLKVSLKYMLTESKPNLNRPFGSFGLYNNHPQKICPLSRSSHVQ